MSQEELCAICGEEVAYLNDMGYCPACSFSEVAVYPADPLTEDDVEELLAPAATADRLLMEERTVAVPVTTHMNVSQPEPAPRSQPEPGNRKASGLADRLKRRGVRMKPDYGPDDAPHVMVTARAGTGKTTTLVQGMRGVLGKDPEEMISDGRWVRITPSEQQQAVWDAMRLSTGLRPCDICFAAFGNKIAKELQRRVPYGCTATTFHKMGFKAVMQRFQLKEGDGAVFSYRTRRHVAELLGLDEYELTRTRPALAHAASSLVRLCKQNLVILDAEDEYEDRRAVQELDALVEHFDVELGQDKYELYKLMPQLLHRALDVEKDQFIDFEDMIWLPVMMGLPLPKYKLLLVDECLPGWTPVMLGDGSSTTIQEIVDSDEEFVVRSYDVDRRVAKNCRVVGKRRILNQKPLVKVRVKHLHRTGTNVKGNFVICTVDHKIWTTNRGWVEAGEVQVGDEVIIETAAATTQKGKITSRGRNALAAIQAGNTRGLGNKGGDPETFAQNKGGNGRGLTLAEECLMAELGEGWGPVTIKTGDAPQWGRGDKPSHYKLDLANLEKMVCVEVDGRSHNARVRAKDRKKQEFLEDLGWKVVRVTNRRAIQQASAVAKEIEEDCPKPAIVTRVEPVHIPDSYVYDISVEDCHNFYANGILVHNCQDLNICQQQMARRVGDRIIMCGDDRQAIFGFAGADADSMPRSYQELSKTPRGCVELKLTTTRRCGKAIVTRAKQYVEEFEAHEDNCEGSLRYASYEEGYAGVYPEGLPHEAYYAGGYRSHVRDGDFVLCRVGAPLVSQCLRFLREGRKAVILGRDVGQNLIALVRSRKAQTMEQLYARMVDWHTEQITKERAKERPSELRIASIQDKYQCIVAFCQGRNSVDDVVAAIRRVFQEDTGSGIVFSTIHKAKGLEAKRVFLLQPRGARMPHPMAKLEWEVQQEHNLAYVAITRAIEELVFVS